MKIQAEKWRVKYGVYLWPAYFIFYLPFFCQRAGNGFGMDCQMCPPEAVLVFVKTP